MGFDRLATLKALRPPYTCCTTVSSLWVVDWCIWNILVQNGYFVHLLEVYQKIFKVLCAYLHTIALLEFSVHIAIYFFCTFIIDHFYVTQRCKLEYPDRIDTKICLIFSLAVIFRYVYHHHIVHCTLAMGCNRLATLKACRPPYTRCTPLKSIWDIEWNIWNILVLMASSCTYYKCIKIFL